MGLDSSVPITADVVSVFDSCVWINLIESHHEVLDKIISLAMLDATKLGVPAIVRSEVLPSTELLDGLKRSWKSRIGEVRRCAHLLTVAQRDRVFDVITASPGSRGRLPKFQDFSKSLDAMLEAIKSYAGDPYRDEVLHFFDSKTAIKIPAAEGGP